jgi:hypothetical protein
MQFNTDVADKRQPIVAIATEDFEFGSFDVDFEKVHEREISQFHEAQNIPTLNVWAGREISDLGCPLSTISEPATD